MSGRISAFCVNTISAGLAVSLVIMLLAMPEASAKPKKIVSNGCTIEQIQAPSSQPCMNQLDQDVINGVTYVHNLFCDETGVYCCQTDGTRTFACKKVSAFRSIMRDLFQGGGQLQVAPQ